MSNRKSKKLKLIEQLLEKLGLSPEDAKTVQEGLIKASTESVEVLVAKLAN